MTELGMHLHHCRMLTLFSTREKPRPSDRNFYMSLPAAQKHVRKSNCLNVLQKSPRKLLAIGAIIPDNSVHSVHKHITGISPT